jgi:hypothetical protein
MERMKLSIYLYQVAIQPNGDRADYKADIKLGYWSAPCINMQVYAPNPLALQDALDRLYNPEDKRHVSLPRYIGEYIHPIIEIDIPDGIYDQMVGRSTGNGPRGMAPIPRESEPVHPMHQLYPSSPAQTNG